MHPKARQDGAGQSCGRAWDGTPRWRGRAAASQRPLLSVWNLSCELCGAAPPGGRAPRAPRLSVPLVPVTNEAELIRGSRSRAPFYLPRLVPPSVASRVLRGWPCAFTDCQGMQITCWLHYVAEVSTAHPPNPHQASPTACSGPEPWCAGSSHTREANRSRKQRA